MEFQFDMSGGSMAIIKRYQVAATKATPGVPVLVPAAGGSGVVVATTTSTADSVGVTIDTSNANRRGQVVGSTTYVTAQQTDSADTERAVGVIINPFAVYSLLMSGGATEGTALQLFTAVSGGSDGLTIVMDDSVASPEMADGTVYCLSGANAGMARKLTSTSTTTATFVVAWPRDVAAGDTFIIAPYSDLFGVKVQLTTLLNQADASIAVGTGAALKPIEMKWDSRTNSYLEAVLANSVFTAAMA